MEKTHTRLPNWMRKSIRTASTGNTQTIVCHHGLHTVCESALCPNKNECFSKGTATFMILGNICTRNCGFCAVKKGFPEPVDSEEPVRIAGAAKKMHLAYVVVTSVTRDDLQDEGASHFAATVQCLKQSIPQVHVEVLTPDFHAKTSLIHLVLASGPSVFNHNLETVERLQTRVRPQADYRRSLKVLETACQLSPSTPIKSGLMLGLGETRQEILQTGRELLATGCRILTLGQYLAPSRNHLPVQEYFTPDFFNDLAEELKSMGFSAVFAGPHVRSSYHAGEVFRNSKSMHQGDVVS